MDLLSRPGRSGVMFRGPAGVGKSRVANEILQRGEAAGYSTAQAMATRATSGVPLGALGSLLPDLSDRTVNPLAGALEGLDRIAGGRPLILNVDDAHLLDEFSAALLLHVAVTSKAFLVITARDEESLPESLHRMWRDGYVERFDLGPLDREETGDVISKALTGPFDLRLADSLQDVSGGNPLILREMITHSVGTGAIHRRGGIWLLEGQLHPSPRLAEIVNDRLRTVDESGRRAISLLSRGEPLSVTVLDSLTGAGVTRELEDRQLVVVTRDERRVEVRLAHPIYGEVVTASRGLLESDALIADLADSLRAVGARRRGDLIRLVTWGLSIGRTMEPGDLYEVARQTHRASDFVSAARFGRHAWESYPSPEVGMLLACDLLLAGENEEADAVLASALSAARTDYEVACLAGSRATNLAASLGRLDEAENVLATAEARINDADAAAVLEAERATLACHRGRFGECLDMTSSLLSGSGRSYLIASIVAEQSLVMTGRHLDAARLAAEASVAHRQAWETELLDFPALSHDVWQVIALAMAGRVVDALELLEAVEERAAREDGPAFIGRLAVARGWLEVLRGRPSAALESLGRGTWFFDSRDPDLPAPVIAALRAMALAAQGRGSEALEVVQPWIGDVSSANPMKVMVGVAEYQARSIEGDPDVSRAGLAALATAEIGKARYGVAFEALAVLTSIGGHEEAAPLLETVAPLIQGPRAALVSSLVAATRSHDGENLVQISKEFEELGLVPLAVESARAASVALSHNGSERKAIAARRRAVTLAGGDFVIRGLDLNPESVRLTPRETDIAQLAAAGVSSQEIADRLFLSVRTVNNHLQHIYQKLGITGRHGLREVLSD